MLLILWKEYGQLGNRLFTFSNLLAFALENNFKLYNLSFVEYSKYFHYFLNDSIPSWPTYKSKYNINKLFASKYILKILRLLLRKRKFVLFLRSIGHLYEADDLCELKVNDINLKFFPPIKFFIVWSAWNLHFDTLREKHRKSLIEFFKPSLSIQNYIDDIFDTIPNNCYMIGIHIRRGDYETYLDGRFFFSFNSYKDLMLKIQSILSEKNVHFIIASNDIIPASLFDSIPVTVLSGTEVEDMYSLARCNLIVGPPSTFADWASFYGNTRRIIFTGTLPSVINY